MPRELNDISWAFTNLPEKVSTEIFSRIASSTPELNSGKALQSSDVGVRGL
jgi:hypothetical protein